jgi:hypothetical protein
MERVEELVLDLIDVLDKNEYIEKFKVLKQELYSDKELDNLIKSYQNEIDYGKKVTLKKKLYENDLFKSIKECEVEINFIIMEINKILKDLTGEKGCH